MRRRFAIVAFAAGCTSSEAPVDRAHVTRTLFLHKCEPSGCVVFPGDDDSRRDRSSMVYMQTPLASFSHDDAVWQDLVDCMRSTYAPFDIEITTLDPTPATHFELMIGGFPQTLGLRPSVGGVAVGACPNAVRDNALGFVFASVLDAEMLCWTAAQESGHMFGLEHAMHAFDPMTWLSPPLRKPGFQDVDAACGETVARPCECGGERQNSYDVLLATLGPAQDFE